MFGRLRCLRRRFGLFGTLRLVIQVIDIHKSINSIESSSIVLKAFGRLVVTSSSCRNHFIPLGIPTIINTRPDDLASNKSKRKTVCQTDRQSEREEMLVDKEEEEKPKNRKSQRASSHALHGMACVTLWLSSDHGGQRDWPTNRPSDQLCYNIIFMYFFLFDFGYFSLSFSCRYSAWWNRIVLLVISMSWALVSIALMGAVYKYRRIKVFKVASPIFLCVTLLGCAIMYAEVGFSFHFRFDFGQVCVWFVPPLWLIRWIILDRSE